MKSITTPSTGPSTTSVTTATTADPPRIRPYSTTPWPRGTRGVTSGLRKRLAAVGRDRDVQRAAVVEELDGGADRRRPLLDVPPGVGRERRDRGRPRRLGPRPPLAAAVLDHRGQCRRKVGGAVRDLRLGRETEGGSGSARR